MANSINTILQADPQADVTAQRDLLAEISPLLRELNLKIKALQDTTTTAKGLHGDAYKQGLYYRDYVFEAMNELRQVVDQLEVLIDYEMWPFPSYTKMLFRLQ